MRCVPDPQRGFGQREAQPWPVPDPRERALARSIGTTDLVARVLLARGLDDPGRIRRYLRPGLDELHDPFAFAQMRRAVERVQRAITAREPILIHGDYDVDGISGSVLLLKLFRLMQADVKVHIPSRQDGYSFSEASLQAVRAGGFRLCISVDNGTNARTYIEKIQHEGCDVIVTDHHGTSEDVAPAHAILNPRLPDAGYPDRELAGVGVAFCLAKATAGSLTRGKVMSTEFESFLLDAMTYVALGTIADVAPLRGENRTLVHHGLRALAESRSPGVRALLDAANLSDRSPDADDVAFRIAPLINAAGRMGQALDAVELLTAPGYHEAQCAARRLEAHNDARRRTERRMVDEVLERARAMDDPILVLADDGWHAGVLGIVAARIAEQLGKPTLLIALDGARGRGSGRSAQTLHLRDALLQCSDCLLAHGGHAAAVGLEIERDRVDDFRRAINERAGPRVALAHAVAPDGLADLHELDMASMRRLDMLGPFGAGNPRPSFTTRGARIAGRPQIDSRGQDLRFRVAQRGTVLPARIKNGGHRLQEVAALDMPVAVTYVPRRVPRAEEGPVELLVTDLRADHAAAEPRRRSAPP